MIKEVASVEEVTIFCTSRRINTGEPKNLQMILRSSCMSRNAMVRSARNAIGCPCRGPSECMP